MFYLCSIYSVSFSVFSVLFDIILCYLPATCVTYVLLMCHLCATYALPMCYICATYVLRMCCLCVTYVLFMCYLCVIYVPSMCYRCVTDVLYMCHESATYMLFIMCRATYVLLMCYFCSTYNQSLRAFRRAESRRSCKVRGMYRLPHAPFAASTSITSDSNKSFHAFCVRILRRPAAISRCSDPRAPRTLRPRYFIVRRA